MNCILKSSFKVGLFKCKWFSWFKKNATQSFADHKTGSLIDVLFYPTSLLLSPNPKKEESRNSGTKNLQRTWWSRKFRFSPIKTTVDNAFTLNRIVQVAPPPTSYSLVCLTCPVTWYWLTTQSTYLLALLVLRCIDMFRTVCTCVPAQPVSSRHHPRPHRHCEVLSN